MSAADSTGVAQGWTVRRTTKKTYVVKLASGKYVRFCTTDKAIGVKRSVATRFDSYTWAAVMLSCIPKDAGPRIVTLRPKHVYLATYHPAPSESKEP